MDLGLQNKIALVTGSNRGTGLMIAQRLAAEGARVIFHSLAEGDAAAVASEMPGSLAVHGDISCAAGSAEVLQAIQGLTSHVDILVNNYGVADRATGRTPPPKTGSMPTRRTPCRLCAWCRA